MIRDQHLAAYLTTIATELDGAVRPHLSSGMAAKSVDSINLLLGRLIGELQAGGEIAGNYQQRWAKLAEHCPTGSANLVAKETSPQRPLSRLDDTLVAIQGQLNKGEAFESFVAALAQGDESAKAWLSESAGTFNRMMQDVEDNFFRPATAVADAASETVDDPELIRRKLGTYLARRFPSLPEDCIESLRIVPGGQVKRTALFKLVANDILPTELVLRQDMPNSITGTTVIDEYDIVKRVFDLGLPVPEPILLEADASVLGGSFIIMREIVGGVGAGTYFPEERRFLGSTMGPDFGYEVAGVFARLHGRTLESGAGEDGAEQQRTVLQLQSEWQAMPSPGWSLGIDLGLAWLRANPLPKGRPRCLIHGDAGSHNMLTRDGHLAALLDWELAKMGDPSEDIAQAKMMLIDDIMPWDDFVRAYVEQGGPPAACDLHAVGYYAVITYVKHGVMNSRVGNYFTEGARTDAAAASVASHWFDRLMLYLSRALATAVASGKPVQH